MSDDTKVIIGFFVFMAIVITGGMAFGKNDGCGHECVLAREKNAAELKLEKARLDSETEKKRLELEIAKANRGTGCVSK